MKEPKYNPGLWVVFKMKDGAGFGKIDGGFFDPDSGWIYHIYNATKPTDTYTVAEVDVTAKSDGGAWTKV